MTILVFVSHGGGDLFYVCLLLRPGMLGFAFGLWTGLAQRRGSGGGGGGWRSPPARCRAEPGSGLVRGPGPWPSNAAAAPRPKGSALAAGNGRPWAIRRSRRGRGRAGTEIRGGGRQTKERGPGAKGPGPRSFRALRAQPPPPSAGFFTNAKAASCNSLAHWASASLLPPLAALGSRSSQRPFRGAEKAASSNAERQRKSPAPQSMGRAT